MVAVDLTWPSDDSCWCLVMASAEVQRRPSVVGMELNEQYSFLGELLMVKVDLVRNVRNFLLLCFRYGLPFIDRNVVIGIDLSVICAELFSGSSMNV